MVSLSPTTCLTIRMFTIRTDPNSSTITSPPFHNISLVTTNHLSLPLNCRTLATLSSTLNLLARTHRGLSINSLTAPTLLARQSQVISTITHTLGSLADMKLTRFREDPYFSRQMESIPFAHIRNIITHQRPLDHYN